MPKKNGIDIVTRGNCEKWRVSCAKNLLFNTTINLYILRRYKNMTSIFGGDLHAGINGIDLPEQSIHLGEGVILSRTYAHLMAPFLMAFKPASKGEHHPAPWKPAQGGSNFDINVELFIPEETGKKFGTNIEVAKTVIFLLRLYVNPAITLPVFANFPFNELANIEDGRAFLFPFEVQPRHFPLGITGGVATKESISWVAANWGITQKLTNESAEFSLAVDAIDGGQFLRQSSLALISLWAAIEALFSPSTAELKFRVSSLVAVFLEPPGRSRLELQKTVSKLYDKRSAAAHGQPRHEPEDLLATFNLLRRILIAMIDQARVPTKANLEQSLFGA